MTIDKNKISNDAHAVGYFVFIDPMCPFKRPAVLDRKSVV